MNFLLNQIFISNLYCFQLDRLYENGQGHLTLHAVSVIRTGPIRLGAEFWGKFKTRAWAVQI